MGKGKNLSYGKSSEKKRSPVLKYFLIGIFIIIIPVGLYFGYHYYLTSAEDACRQETENIFAKYQNADFSSFDADTIPDLFKDSETDEAKSTDTVKANVSSQLMKKIEGTLLEKLFSYSDQSSDYDFIWNEIISNASYEITDVEASATTCKVTVTTKNKDYIEVSEKFQDKLPKSMVSDLSLWESVKNSIANIIFGSDDETTTNGVFDKLSEYYDECTEEAGNQTYSGILRFSYEDGKWVLTNIDSDVILNYYGLIQD